MVRDENPDFVGLSALLTTTMKAMKETIDALAKAHPGYGWERNQGYGTAEHRAALARLGVTAEHRRSFLRVAENVKEVLEGDLGLDAHRDRRRDEYTHVVGRLD